jgi:hypothetical protein
MAILRQKGYRWSVRWATKSCFLTRQQRLRFDGFKAGMPSFCRA